MSIFALKIGYRYDHYFCKPCLLNCPFKAKREITKERKAAREADSEKEQVERSKRTWDGGLKWERSPENT